VSSTSPELAAALLDVCSAVTYDDFANAAVNFCVRTVPHTAGEVLLNYVDFDADANRALVVRNRFPTKLARTPEERKMRQKLIRFVGRHFERFPETTVYRGQAMTIPSGRALEKTDWFKHIMLPEGWHDFLGMHFRVAGRHHSTIFINRGLDQPLFSADEFAVFEQAFPYFSSTLQRVRLLEDARARNTDLETSIFDLPVATLLLDWQLNVEQANRAAAQLCAAWQHGPERARALKFAATPEVPADIRDACARLREAWIAADTGAARPVRRVLAHPEFPQLEAKITLLRPHALRLAHPSFLVRITDAAPGTEVAPGSVAATTAPVNAQLLARLSPAERELIPHLRQGLSNKEISAVLGKSVPTVKKQLHSVLEKLGRPSRARLIALLK
jgi:DNA-binding CsgD family transcriptional regulator